MNREFYLKSICDNIALLSHQVEMRNAINLYDINIVAEDFYSGLLNSIYDYHLINLNTIEKNAAAIDLADKDAKISVQVTSDNSSIKIKDTIDKFIDNKYYETYNRLIILILTRKKKYTTIFDTKSLFDFDKDSDIIDCGDLIKEVKKKKTGDLERIFDFLNTELSHKVNKVETNESSEVETIIALIEYFTSNKEVSKKIDSVIDPEFKIKKRFKDYASRIEKEYTQLFLIYGEALKVVDDRMPLDEAQEIVIMIYLQDISITYLEHANNDPLKALNLLVDYFEEKISTCGKKYDKIAIKFYLVNEIIKCNLFPNERDEYNACN
ncbi:SMEK domain-containing protein [Tissierellaceae bacterium HCP3S3_D8]